MDICHSGIVGGRTRHVEVKMYFLRELREMVIVKVVWRFGDNGGSIYKESTGALV